MDIRILPSNIANMIAAGEVVQRPASAVKELMENAVDAGATQITVILTDSGRTLIQVIDNGCGMSPDQAVLCFERHATSKIATAEDLNDITTFGFRGEALASIAAVSEVTLKTRRDGDEVGCQVEFADSKHISTEEISTPVGSNFSVRNLFYNVPARRKFMKSDNVELRHVIEEFTRVALTRPEIGFRLMNNGKDIHVLKPAKSLKYRIQDLLGSSVVSQVVDISAETTVVKINGYVGRPDQAKKTLGNQFFFVNGRFFRSPYFHKAVMNAYENMLPQGTTPSYFIFMEVDPHSIDVNIHPTKTEVKFEDDSVVFQVLFACVKESLGRNSFGASSDCDKENMLSTPNTTRSTTRLPAAKSRTSRPSRTKTKLPPAPSLRRLFRVRSMPISQGMGSILPMVDTTREAMWHRKTIMENCLRSVLYHSRLSFLSAENSSLRLWMKVCWPKIYNGLTKASSMIKYSDH